MKRIYGKPSCETDTASAMHPNEPNGAYYTCPCCNSQTSNGDIAQAKYWSTVDELFNVLTDDSNHSRISAITHLITMLNSQIITKVTRLTDEGSFCVDSKTAKMRRINNMILKLAEVRE